MEVEIARDTFLLDRLTLRHGISTKNAEWGSQPSIEAWRLSLGSERAELELRSRKSSIEAGLEHTRGNRDHLVPVM
jgi:hypothetical protein